MPCLLMTFLALPPHPAPCLPACLPACSRELHARLLAARGFLYMVTQEMRNGSGSGGTDTFDHPGPSQATMSQLSALSGGGAGGGTLLHEVIHACADLADLTDDSTEEEWASRLAPVLLRVLWENPALLAYIMGRGE